MENHCSPEQRYVMSRMFIEIFGGKSNELRRKSREDEKIRQ